MQSNANKNLITQGSNGDLRKTPEAKKRKSRAELSNGNGMNGNLGGHSFDRRTFDPAADKIFVKREDIAELHMGGMSIYADSQQQP